MMRGLIAHQTDLSAIFFGDSPMPTFNIAIWPVCTAAIMVIVLAGCTTKANFGMLSDGADSSAAKSIDSKPLVLAHDDKGQWQVVRVGGDLEARIAGENGDYRYGPSVVDTELPAGYPPPTPAGAIELKRYPTVRRAEVSGRTNPDWGMNLGFWPLFQHIQRRDIAMTSPVEVDYAGWGIDSDASSPSTWTMSFLYRTPDLGPTGDDGRVRVIDLEPLTVVAIGFAGPYRLSVVKAGLERINEWLDSQDEWVSDGPPRAMYYNDPSVAATVRWGEVQVPIRRAE